MALPPDIFPVNPDQAALDRASDLIKALEHACDEGDFAPPALQELRDLTENPRLTVEQYHEVSGHTGYDDAALLAFCPEPRKIDGLSFADFEELCAHMMDNLLNGRFDYWFSLFWRNAKLSSAGDLVFYPPQAWIDRLIDAGEVAPGTKPTNFEPTPQQIAVEAWRSDAIQL